MNVPIECPHGEYRDGMRIFCKKADNYCGHQYFKRCKGWWALTNTAAACPLRKGEKNV